MRRAFGSAACLAALNLVLSLVIATAVQAEKRVALVIGNGAYKNAPRLPNPPNDASDVSGALRRIGFETIVGTDLDKGGMEDATIRFSRAARDADVAIFYYSGHAMQYAGVNYLMPVDAKLTDEADLRRMARVDDIVSDVQLARNLRILVLDSCRDNPLAEELKRSIGKSRSAGLSRGLAKIDAPQGMIVAYATQSGRTADDGEGRNSPYTAAFLTHIEAQEEIGTVFRRVSAQVFEQTKRSQLPELSLSLIGEYYLKGRPAPGAPAVPKQEPAAIALNETPPPAKRESTLRRVRDRGQVLCGTNGNLPGFSSVDGSGNYAGLDVDFCRALAAVIFDDPSKVKFVALGVANRFTALQKGDIDVLARNTTRTAQREMEMGLRFGQNNFYDGQAFMVRKALNVKSASELGGASICVQSGTTTELATVDFFRTKKLEFRPVPYAASSDSVPVYGAGRCDAITNDRSALYAIRAQMTAPEEHVILPEIISNEAIAPAVRKGDDEWFDIVNWVQAALVNAEEFGVTRDNVEAARQSKDPSTRRLLGIDGAFGERMGLTKDWAYRAVRHVGNYGEIYDRNMGAGSKLKMDRGPNALVRNGGQHQSPPIR